MINLCIINASPRGRNNSRSDFIINNIIKLLSNEVKVTKYYSGDIINKPNLFEEIIKNDVLLFASPLYADSIPSSALRFLYSFDDFLAKKEKKINLKVYGLINCGFLEGTQNKIALQILENFCVQTKLNWCFGVGIGAGEALPELGQINSPKGLNSKIYKALSSLVSSIQSNNNVSHNSNIFVNPLIPKYMYILAAHHGWKLQAKNKFKLKSKDLYKKIYTNYPISPNKF